MREEKRFFLNGDDVSRIMLIDSDFITGISYFTVSDVQQIVNDAQKRKLDII